MLVQKASCYRQGAFCFTILLASYRIPQVVEAGAERVAAFVINETGRQKDKRVVNVSAS